MHFRRHFSFRTLLSGLFAGLILSACSNSATHTANFQDLNGVRPLSAAEQGNDFDQLLEMFKNYYGPYKYKEQLLGINIEELAMKLKAQAQTAKTDEEFAGYVMQMGAALRDGHVQIRIVNTHSGISRYKMPIVVTPLEGKAIIGDISKEITALTGLQVGDEILSVDGKSPFEILKTALKYRSGATDLSNQHFILYAFSRPSYMTDLIPTSPLATVKGMKADGTIVSYELPWEVEKYVKDLDKVVKPVAKVPLNLTVPFESDLNSLLPSHRMQMGQVNPIFVTPQSQQTYQFLPVTASEEFRKKYELTEKETPPIYAAMYRFNNKNMLLVRMASYYQQDFGPPVYMKAYQALLDQYQSMADVLVLDQTHNPGGSYCADFYNIFAQSNDVQAVQRQRADRKWINDFMINWPLELQAMVPNNPIEIAQSLAMGRIVEQAHERGDFLSEPLPIFTGSKHAVLKKFQWKKPMLVLIDSIAGSCGDIFPMLVKANPREHVKLFGEATMGLGGNVEQVGTLNNSQIQVSMTRGLFSAYKEDGNYLPSDYIENNGVTPDFPYSISIQDFRGGYVDYIRAFSEKAVSLVK